MPVYAVEQKEHTLDAANAIASRTQTKQQLINGNNHTQQPQQPSSTTTTPSDVEEDVQPVDDVLEDTDAAPRVASSSSSFEDDEAMSTHAPTSNNTTPLEETIVEKPLSVVSDIDTTSTTTTASTTSTSTTPSPVTTTTTSVNPIDHTISTTTTISELTEHNIIIFDWDDTLLASSFLATHGYRLDIDMEHCDNHEFVKTELKMLENCVTSIIEEALQYGKVHIITNAETGWVEMSARKFLPGVVPFLNRVHVLSARSTYEHLFPDSPMKWKYCAMQERLSHVISHEGSRKNIISFGDSHVEREAVRAVTRGVPNTRTKSIKFAECPNTEQLRKQLELVANCFHFIFTHEGDLDLMLKMSMVPANNNNNTNTNTTANA